MFERFTDRARRVCVLALEEARSLNYNSIGVEHLLLGLLREEKGVAGQVLTTLGVTLEDVRTMVRKGEQPLVGRHIPYTPQAKKAMELALREALQLGHPYIGTEHLLLGLIREGSDALKQLMGQPDLNLVRMQVLQVLKKEVDDLVEAAKQEVSPEDEQLALQLEHIASQVRKYGANLSSIKRRADSLNTMTGQTYGVHDYKLRFTINTGRDGWVN